MRIEDGEWKIKNWELMIEDEDEEKKIENGELIIEQIICRG